MFGWGQGTMLAQSRSYDANECGKKAHFMIGRFFKGLFAGIIESARSDQRIEAAAAQIASRAFYDWFREHPEAELPTPDSAFEIISPHMKRMLASVVPELRNEVRRCIAEGMDEIEANRAFWEAFAQLAAQAGRIAAEEWARVA